MITIIYKTGKKDSQDGRLFKSRRKNAKEVNEETDNKLYPHSSDEVNNLCFYPMDNTGRKDSGIVIKEKSIPRTVMLMIGELRYEHDYCYDKNAKSSLCEDFF